MLQVRVADQTRKLAPQTLEYSCVLCFHCRFILPSPRLVNILQNPIWAELGFSYSPASCNSTLKSLNLTHFNDNHSLQSAPEIPTAAEHSIVTLRSRMDSTIAHPASHNNSVYNASEQERSAR